MLDKSVEFIDVLMHRKAGTPFKRYPLPEGYAFRLFSPGDEAAWAAIETSVLEFENDINALLYFQRERMPYVEELVRRCLFIENASGEKVATASAWWDYTGMRRDPWLHWVAVKPGEQGKGLGKAIVGEALYLITQIEGDRDVYLHTQTWSHKAVELYEKAGFAVSWEPWLGQYRNDRCLEAVTLLNSLRRIHGRPKMGEKNE
ncbi:GNAT family N-acetyltransferase [Ruminococcaceae bacterium OttesenSCG-928-L11]|nr:GNAT family N-acetyltransferase [Ruminococcaceae bacterium OttesenSCG-928-L11]